MWMNMNVQLSLNYNDKRIWTFSGKIRHGTNTWADESTKLIYIRMVFVGMCYLGAKKIRKILQMISPRSENRL
jgi:hypothetical protein